MGGSGLQVVGQVKGVAAGEEDAEVGVLGQEAAYVAFHLEAGTVDGTGKHGSAGVGAHEGGVWVGFEQGEQGCVLVHGLEAELYACGYDTAEDFADCRDEVVGDARACIDDEERMTRRGQTQGSEVCCQAVGSVARGNGFQGIRKLWAGVYGAARDAEMGLAQPEGVEGLGLQDGKQFGVVGCHGGDDTMVDSEVACQLTDGFCPACLLV